ncbi:uncharacterized protein LY89DRAFT_668628 [Mollisia scopiformis]|uniref:DUF7587 domain-containing protein n=1 Tax=Mollisia scopiformis TaxID=149040 RepID=A0A194XAW9_MOLSC|nr:uncharacterized protein LY89DRAFT_668628 [Mollisia scopiformis]KUJ17289.1 hypothetical protein LY89DRAFT_668628 [Mollisia scopiformis]
MPEPNASDGSASDPIANPDPEIGFASDEEDGDNRVAKKLRLDSEKLSSSQELVQHHAMEKSMDIVDDSEDEAPTLIVGPDEDDEDIEEDETIEKQTETSKEEEESAALVDEEEALDLKLNTPGTSRVVDDSLYDGYMSDDEIPPGTALPASQQESSKKRKLNDFNVSNKRTAELSKYEIAQGKLYKQLHDNIMFNLLLVNRLAEKLNSTHQPTDLAQLKEVVEQMQVDSRACMEKYKNATERKKSPNNNVPHPKTAKQILERLKGEEDNANPWGTTPEKSEELPDFAFRVFHDKSQSRIVDDRVGFQSAKAYGVLNTAALRKIKIERHANWKNRFLTSFISMSDSLPHLIEYFIPKFQEKYKIKKNPDNTKLTLININARTAAKYPTIPMGKQAGYYNVRLGSGKIFDAEYLALWEITPPQIVCKMKANRLALKRGERHSSVYIGASDYWLGKDLRAALLAAEAFQEQVAKPAYEKHETARLAAVAADAAKEN